MPQRVRHGSAKTPSKTATVTPPPSLPLSLLFSVQFEHGFYNLQGGACPDFRVVPSPASARFMAGTGLIFRDNRSGFGVYCPPSRLNALTALLQQNAAAAASRGSSPPPASGGAAANWSWLSFALLLTNPNFGSITALPLTPGLAPNAVHASNLSAHACGSTTVLCGGDSVSAADLYQVVGETFSLAVPATAAGVTVTDISGATVHASTASAGSATVMLPVKNPGFYTVCTVTAGGDVVAAAGFPKSVLYVPPAHGVTGWLDIVLTPPSTGMAGIYPVPASTGAAGAPVQIGNVTYTLPFPARSTFWLYYIIPRDSGTRLTNLAIQRAANSPNPEPPVTFGLQSGQQALPNGAMAALFISGQPFTLQQNSSLRFQLSGTRLDTNSLPSPVRVSPLPLAAAAPVWPSGTADFGLSEIYVYV